jgi:vanillate/3-O-methylgallate O-demethylase
VTNASNSMRATPEGYFTTRWGLPEYTDWIDESMSWKETCYVGDWSWLWDRRFKGADALRLLSDITVNSFEEFAIGQAKHAIHCNEAGKVIHEGILIRLDDQEFMLQGRGCLWADFNLQRGRYDATSEAEDWFKFQVSGPNSPYVIEKMSGESVRDIPFMHRGEIRVGGRSVWALRQGMAGEVGFELQGPRSYAGEIYDAILHAGEDFGIRRLGGRAVFINHLEACFPTRMTDYLSAIYDDDMKDYLEVYQATMPGYVTTFNVAGSFEAESVGDYYRSPVELGWTKNIKFDHEFIGRPALEEEVANPKRTMRTLVWNSDDVVDVYASLFRTGRPYHFMDMPRDQRGFMWADKVVIDGRPVGVSTSRGYSYFFRQMISLCTLDIGCSEPGTEVTLIWGNPGEPQKEIRATVAPAPYKKDNRRSDLSRL